MNKNKAAPLSLLYLPTLIRSETMARCTGYRTPPTSRAKSACWPAATSWRKCSQECPQLLMLLLLPFPVPLIPVPLLAGATHLRRRLMRTFAFTVSRWRRARVTTNASASSSASSASSSSSMTIPQRSPSRMVCETLTDSSVFLQKDTESRGMEPSANKNRKKEREKKKKKSNWRVEKFTGDTEIYIIRENLLFDTSSSSWQLKALIW